jgi:thiamine pyrophosphokinase
MEKVFIISGGKLHKNFLREQLQREKQPVLIAADRGVEACIALQVVPDFMIGDFDSLPEELQSELAELQQQGAELIRLQPEKDDTDTEAALSLALERTAGDIVILGATGSRLDHVLGNIAILGRGLRQHRNVILLDEHNRIRMVTDRLVLGRQEQYGRYVSVLPYGDAEDVTLQGVRYPLEHVHMDGFTSLGVSNEITAEEAVISVGKGTLLVIESLD